jgi:hypothetical protein
MAETNERSSLNFKIQLEMYPFTVYFSAGESDKAIQRRFKKEDLNEYEIDLLNFKPGVNGRAVLYPGVNLAVMRLKSFAPTEPGFYSALHHELTHLVHFILNEIGMRLSDDSDEAYTYLTGYLTKKIYEKILCKAN